MNKPEPTPVEAMMEVMSAMSPIFDAADGIRADMEKRGWSPTMAEAAAGEWLMATLRKVMSS